MIEPGHCPGVTLVLGGTRSGKSQTAERLATSLASDAGGIVTYVATAIVADAHMEQRVALHRARRPSTWATVEVRSSAELPHLLARLDGTVVLDSLGAWVASAPELRVDEQALLAALRSRAGSTVIVSEEVGLSVHPPTRAGRDFADALGELNQAVAAIADKVLLVVAGRALEL
jgi:adenosyl cobinamide kinase/adenosyl cobinamide phosphate guanylyltransferase